jgi:hypothetical protein
MKGSEVRFGVCIQVVNGIKISFFFFCCCFFTLVWFDVEKQARQKWGEDIGLLQIMFGNPSTPPTGPTGLMTADRAGNGGGADAT